MKYTAILEDEHIVRIGDKPCLHCFNGLMEDYFIPVKERKAGKWIEVLGGCKCPFCDMAFSRLHEDCADNFCPNCGADMRGSENG